MRIILERTRLIFSEYDNIEKKRLEDLVATTDKVYHYEDIDNHKIYLPTGMSETIKKTFKLPIEDKSMTHWEFASIAPVEHSAEPRNQLQKDFIKFVLEHAEKKQKLAGILSPGSGKCEPLNNKIPAVGAGPWKKRMGDIKVGDKVFGSNCKPVTVTGVFPQGVKSVYRLLISGGKNETYLQPNKMRVAKCGLDHLWTVKDKKTNEIKTLPLSSFLHSFSQYKIPYITKDKMYWGKIAEVSYIGKEECQCISVDAEDQLYITTDDIVTHNTFMACYAALKVLARTLIVVPTSSIKDQWAATLTGMFKVPPERVLNVSSPRQFVNVKADFTIVSQASLAVLNKNYDLEKIMKTNKFGIRITDEVQMWFQNIINVESCSNICHNWYLTGTFGRSGDEENALYQTMFGDLAMFREKEKSPTFFNRKPGNVYGMKPHMNVKMVWTKSGLTEEEIKSCTSSMRYSERTGEWMRFGISIPAFTKLVIPSDGRITFFMKKLLQVIKMAESEVTYGRTLILSATIESVEILKKHIKEMFPDKMVGSVHSRNDKRENDRVKNEDDIILSTVKSAGTGFDIKGKDQLSKLIVSENFKSWILTSQVMGRLRRRDDGRETYAWDIVPADIKQLRVWANLRSDIEKRISKTFTVIDL